MNKRLIIIFGCILLSGCAPSLLTTSTNNVVIRAHNDSAGDAQILADTECKKFTKTARLNQTVPANVAESTYFFDCK